MAAEGTFPKSDGDILYASEANLLNGVFQVYTGAGFDSYQFESAGTDEQSYELTAIPASSLTAAVKYVKISALVLIETKSSNQAGDSAETKFKIQVKETGGSYGDDLAYIRLGYARAQESENVEGPIQIVWMHEVTAGERTNGAQFKIFSSGTLGASVGGTIASVTNKCTVQELA